jgi:hypothetical protein
MAFSCSSALWVNSGIILPHDNVRPHVAHSIQLDQLHAMRREMLPACSPVSWPRDFSMSGVTDSPQTHIGHRCDALVWAAAKSLVCSLDTLASASTGRPSMCLWFLRRVRKIAKRVMSFRPSVCLHGTQLPLYRFSWHFIPEYFSKNYWQNSSFIRIWQK